MSLPPNIHLSQHPSLKAKLSQLRSHAASSKEVKTLVHDISLILACDALITNLSSVEGPKDKTPLNFEYTTTVVRPQTICIVPILRSGLGMVDGMYREPSTLTAVEYYNNLSHHIPGSDDDAGPASSLVILVDPIIATGGTCIAAIQTLREWGAKKVLVLSVLASEEGVKKAAEEWPEGTELWIAGLDTKLTEEGMLEPGLGDIGDRLFLTLGK
ncbi:hypothetical protein E4U43_001017 [Claviceps pusilla]|uniref:uracil phosphoribosyltransferase n=1 Tax=Claviceps pusilla TaxID=123648 RepID=A0A9P7SZI9_9HYPO|nr:hypothetical protein E4U43_001017 [Claviceps pusilla]